jgi:hypothetical protein
MIDAKNIFFDRELRCGGFYELAIQVCPSTNNEPIKLYSEYVWSLQNVHGPYDDNFSHVQVDIATFRHEGLIKLNHLLPFITYNVRETEPIETGFNWFDIGFYSAAIEHIFGSEFQTWSETPVIPQELSKFLFETMISLYHIYPFELAMIGYEVSGQYYLHDLTKPLNNNWTASNIYVGKNNFTQVAVENQKMINILS